MKALVQPPGFSLELERAVSNIDKSRLQNIDYVKSMGVSNSGHVIFGFKGFDSKNVQFQKYSLNEISEKYLEALKKSQVTQDWEPIVVEPQEK